MCELRHLHLSPLFLAGRDALQELRLSAQAARIAVAEVDRTIRIGPADFGPQGLLVGHSTDLHSRTGVTVIRGALGPFRAAATRLGRATSTRQFDALSPDHIVDRIDAIVLSGGSAFGLDTAAGVLRWMEERGRGFRAGPAIVPIVPTAVVFDLAPPERKQVRPKPEDAYAACDIASASGFGEGSVGAGTGATVGKVAGIARCMKGGFGAASASSGSISASAAVVVNAFGNVVDNRGHVLAGARDVDGGFVDAQSALARGEGGSRFRSTPDGNTTLAVVSLSAALSRLELLQLSSAASAALFRRITPVGTPVDGDVIFATAPLTGASVDLLMAESLAVIALEHAIERAVMLATGTADVPSASRTNARDGGARAPLHPGESV